MRPFKPRDKRNLRAHGTDKRNETFRKSHALDCEAGRFGSALIRGNENPETPFREVDTIRFFDPSIALFLRNRVPFAQLPLRSFPEMISQLKKRQRDDGGKNSSFVRDRFAEREWSFGGRRVEWPSNFKMKGEEWVETGKLSSKVLLHGWT